MNPTDAPAEGHRLYTIGHSVSPLPTFLATLAGCAVGCLADVRSRPQSSRFPHFDRPALEAALSEAGIRYVFLGEELGGRPDDPEAYADDGVVNYRARRKSFGFQAGIEQVLRELAERDVALVCAEEDPLECHRFLMICPELVLRGLEPLHLRKGGIVETQREAEDRLLEIHQLGAVARDSLFAWDRQAALETALDAQSKLHAFRLDPAQLGRW